MKTLFPCCILLLILSIQGFSQERTGCEGSMKHAKRYHVKSGVLNYVVYSVTRKGQKKAELFRVAISFDNYGGVYERSIGISNKPGKRRVDTSFMPDSSDSTFLDYFVPDSCSVHFKGISMIKPLPVNYKKMDCTKFIQFRFTSAEGRLAMGTVTYFKDIPVYIRGGSKAHSFIWELENSLAGLNGNL